jgi:hypothetical protein
MRRFRAPHCLGTGLPSHPRERAALMPCQTFLLYKIMKVLPCELCVWEGDYPTVHTLTPSHTYPYEPLVTGRVKELPNYREVSRTHLSLTSSSSTLIDVSNTSTQLWLCVHPFCFLQWWYSICTKIYTQQKKKRDPHWVNPPSTSHCSSETQSADHSNCFLYVPGLDWLFHLSSSYNSIKCSDICSTDSPAVLPALWQHRVYVPNGTLFPS